MIQSLPVTQKEMPVLASFSTTYCIDKQELFSMQLTMASFIVDHNDVIIVYTMTRKPYYDGNILPLQTTIQLGNDGVYILSVVSYIKFLSSD